MYYKLKTKNNSRRYTNIIQRGRIVQGEGTNHILHFRAKFLFWDAFHP